MTSGSSGLHDATKEPAHVARAAMLQMARSAQASGQVYHAVHIYDHLLEDFPNTQESHQAAGDMIALARFLETQGMYHTALSLYERLEQLQ